MTSPRNHSPPFLEEWTRDTAPWKVCTLHQRWVLAQSSSGVFLLSQTRKRRLRSTVTPTWAPPWACPFSAPVHTMPKSNLVPGCLSILCANSNEWIMAACRTAFRRNLRFRRKESSGWLVMSDMYRTRGWQHACQLFATRELEKS